MFGRKKLQKIDKPKNIGIRLHEFFSNSLERHSRWFEELEDLLIEGDFGTQLSAKLVDELRKNTKSSAGNLERENCFGRFKTMLHPILKPLDLDLVPDRFALYIVFGVNGVGKTTTIAKMAHRYMQQDCGPLTLAAADTFRAAAIDQLGLLGERIGARVVKQHHGADPAAVIFDAIQSAKSRNEKIVIADTAGRMHNKTNLIKELEKINRISLQNLSDNDIYRKILVIDATTGQNGLRQAEDFHEAIGVDAIVMTKYDSSSKGGILASISWNLGIPFAYIGHGEQMEDLLPFDPQSYLDEIFGD